MTEAEADAACEALIPHVGAGSHIVDLIRASVKAPKAIKVKKTLKSVLKPRKKTSE